ncbi:hypothetical protein [Kribbella sp.]|uniref:hypothetical protein n=1 Tax=Kribbella sp. TaxID=1871183 RepID=UPI002D45C15D|nr:hypothetical protein [Kribbella sp.]HZX01989.1 hypothetical protein [Kribbella sp.]
MKVTTFRELMREQANAAVQVSGAHHSSWNGRFGAPIARESDLGGTANWDSSISYNPRHVDERLQQMFHNNRVHNQDRSELVGYRDAMRVVLHENVHMLSSEGRDHSQSQAAFATGPGVRPLEEGMTELYSHQALNDYIDELGVDQVAPGIKNVKSAQVYKEYTPAAEGFAETVGQKSGLQREELIERLAVVPADQKFTVAAAAMYDNSRLPGMIPEDQREQAIGQIAKAMGSEFGRVERLPKSADADTRRAVGRQAAVEGSKVMTQLKQQWRMPAPGQQMQRGVATEQQQAAQPDHEAQGPASPAGLPPDIAAAARVGLSGPPLASASRLRADRQGARGTGSTSPGVQRQGPETQR